MKRVLSSASFRAFSAIAGTAFVILTWTAPSADAAPRMLVDVTTGQVIEHEDAFQRWYPASLTKLMTAYVAFRAMASGEAEPTSPVTISAKANAEPPSKMYYGEGATMTLDAALKIIMVKSANDVAMAIGESLAGSERAFVERMNAEAARIGMISTRFINPHGLPGEGQYTTARDMAVLAQALKREFPQYAEYFSLEAIKAGDNTYENFNMLIGRFPGADGMKTGFICSSGFNQVSSASRNGRSVVAVVFGAESLADRAEQSAELLHKGLSTPSVTRETLANLQPYGETRDQIVDLRPQICSPEAAAARGEGRDDEGELILNSRYLPPLTRELEAVTVSLGGTGGRVAAIAADVPVPTPRPNLIELGDIQNAPVRAEIAAGAALDADGSEGEQSASVLPASEPAVSDVLRPALTVPLPKPRPAL